MNLVKEKKRRTAKAPVGAKAARSGKKMEPGAMHGPARIPILQMLQTARYAVSRIDIAIAVRHFY